MTDATSTFGVSLVTRDVDATIEFFRTLGVNIPDSANWRSHHVGIEIETSGLDLDSVELTKSFDPAWSGSAVVLILRVPTRDAVDDTYTRAMDAGHPSQLAPFDAFWGARYAVVRDPDGNAIGIMSPQDESRSSPPPI
ncbi:MAG TPA: VOC family protein [Acidimicrobiales bacterium]